MHSTDRSWRHLYWWGTWVCFLSFLTGGRKCNWGRTNGWNLTSRRVCQNTLMTIFISWRKERVPPTKTSKTNFFVCIQKRKRVACWIVNEGDSSVCMTGPIASQLAIYSIPSGCAFSVCLLSPPSLSYMHIYTLKMKNMLPLSVLQWESEIIMQQIKVPDLAYMMPVLLRDL